MSNTKRERKMVRLSSVDGRVCLNHADLKLAPLRFPVDDLAPGCVVPVLKVDVGGGYWWAGLRKVWASGASYYYSLEGRHVRVSLEEVETSEGALLWFAVYRETVADGRFPAPFPLETVGDALAYRRAGWTVDRSPAALARAARWAGPGAAYAAERLAAALVAFGEGSTSEEVAAARASLAELVRFPAAADHGVRVERLPDLRGVVRALESRVAALESLVESLI